MRWSPNAPGDESRSPLSLHHTTMPRRRTSPPHGGHSQGGRSRRVSIRRSPQDNVRVSAAWVVERTLASLAPTNSFLETALARFDHRDRALLQELVYGTLRWLRRLDRVIMDASNRRMEEIEEGLHSVLRVAAYQLLFLHRIPSHAAVNEAVEQARCLTHRGAANFVNAVLRRIARDRDLGSWPVEEPHPVRRLAIEWSHPDLLAERWVRRFGLARATRLMRANNRPKPMHLLAFRHRGGRELLAEELIDAGLDVEPSKLSPLGLTVRRGNALDTEAFRRGAFYVQDEVSQVAALLPEPRSGERILDAAGFPGGKTFALLAWEPNARVVLGDVEPARVDRVLSNLRRLDLKVPLFLADAGQSPLAQRSFDRVLVDLPCSGTGTLRKNPELKWRLSGEEIRRLCKGSRRILAGVANQVVPGGLLVAMTCSLEEDENEAVIAAFLEERPDFEPLPLAGLIPSHLEEGLAAPALWRIFPEDDHDGFSAHVLQRKK